MSRFDFVRMTATAKELGSICHNVSHIYNHEIYIGLNLSFGMWKKIYIVLSSVVFSCMSKKQVRYLLFSFLFYYSTPRNK